MVMKKVLKTRKRKRGESAPKAKASDWTVAEPIHVDIVNCPVLVVEMKAGSGQAIYDDLVMTCPWLATAKAPGDLLAKGFQSEALKSRAATPSTS